MHSGFCYSDSHLSLLGLKALTDEMIRSVEKSDRRRLYRARKELFSLCDAVGYLFDSIEYLRRQYLPYYNIATREIKFFTAYLLDRVTGCRSVMRLMARSFKETLEGAREAHGKISYQALLDGFVGAIDETSLHLAELRSMMERHIKAFGPEIKVDL